MMSMIIIMRINCTLPAFDLIKNTTIEKYLQSNTIQLVR